MTRLRKNVVLVAFAIASLVANSPHPAFSADSDISAIQGSGIYNNVDVWRIDSSANVKISSYTSSGVAVPHTTISNQGVETAVGNRIINSPSDLYFGSPSVVPATTTTSGSSQGAIFTAYLGAATAALEGSLLCATTTVVGQGITVMVCPATNALTNWVGVSAVAASTGSVINVYNEGWVLALTTGTVNPGDVLVSTAIAAGYLVAQNAPTTGTDVAVALGAGPAAGGTTKVRLR